MIQDRLRKNSNLRPANKIDGVMNAPARGATQNRQVGVATTREVGGFKRSEGFHSANVQRPSSNYSRPDVRPAQTPKTSGDSILHMSLPSSSLGDGRRGNRNKKKKQKPTGWRAVRRWSLRSAGVLAALALLVGGFLFAKAYFSAGQVFQGGGEAAALSCSAEVEPSALKQEGDGRINILMMGEDNEASLTDSILVASIDPVNKKTAMVSIPRDLWVSSASAGSSKVNAVYPLAKQAALAEKPDNERAAKKKAVEELQTVIEDVLGININYYVTVDVAGFERAVDIVGGVEMNVPEELAVSEHMWDDVRSVPYHLDVPAGQQKFDPQRALFFVRTRKTSTRGDFDRTERQRLFLNALAGKVLSAGTYTNPVRITKLMDAFKDNVVTNFSIDDAVCMAKNAQDLDTKNMLSVGLADDENPVVTTGWAENQSIVQPVAGIGVNDEIHQLVRKSFVDGYITRENAKIIVLNGSGVGGQATAVKDELKSYGYKVIRAGDAPSQDFQSSTIVNLSGDSMRYTEHYLQNRFETQATDQLPEGISLNPNETADFVVILGSR
jgi:polyisoprenyl-teichoic acid--peptidoglycan teichoic acid transferase